MAAGWNKGKQVKPYLCKHCGETEPAKFFSKNKMKSCCSRCHTIYTHQKLREIKLKAIEYLGGKCSCCGVTGVPAIYDFHHKDAAEKDFSWGDRRTSNWESLQKELDKCILLCANCHRELHDKEWFDQLSDTHPEKLRRMEWSHNGIGADC